MRITASAVRQLLAKRAYERVTPDYYPVGFVPEEPGFITGYDDTGRSEAYEPDDYDRATGRAVWR